MAKKTKAPSGFSIWRDGANFYLSWKIKAKNSNDGQKRRYRVNNGKWSSSKALGAKTTKTSVKVDRTSITSVTIQIQDNQDKSKSGKVKDLKASAWAGATFNFKKPPKPICSMALSETAWNVCDVAYSHAGNDFTTGDNIWFIRTECQTTFHSENEKDNWITHNLYLGESGSFSKREDTLPLSTDLAYVRRFRFRILGRAGYNEGDYVTCSHYYSTPYTPVIKSVSISENDSGGIVCNSRWYSKSDEFHPIDQTIFQYGIAVPGPNMSCPSDITWVDRPVAMDTPGDKVEDGDNFYIDTTIDLDKCLFARVHNTHDNNSSYSKPMLATGLVTTLKAPSNFGIPDFDPLTFRVVVHAENESEVPDANLAIVFRGTKAGDGTDQVIGILPKGVEDMTVQCPNWSEFDEYNFGVYAFVGDFGNYVKTEDERVYLDKDYYTRTGNEEQTATPISNPTGNPHDQGYYELYNDDEYFITDDTKVVPNKTYYTLSEFIPYSYTLVNEPVTPELDQYYELRPYAVKETDFEYDGQTLTYQTYEIPNIKMRSRTIWRGGDLPSAPDINVTTPRAEVATVTWTWPWKSADIAELSWSDQDDAWESTEPPDTYRVANVHAGKWNIHGLTAGMSWYIRVRLIKTTNGVENAGPWSRIATLDMASTPNAPVLTISKKAVTHDGAFTISWEYDSDDGTDQKSAVLRYATLSPSGEVIYGEEIESDLGTVRSIDIIPDDRGWTTGEKYGFVLKVISETGKHSPWSGIEFITIANPLETEILSTSLEDVYSLVQETELIEDKIYYTRSGLEEPYTYTEVVSPVESELETYYEKMSNCLTKMPFNVSASITGGSESGYSSLFVIERAAPYFVDRPDETTYTGYIGETVYSDEILNPSNISINQTDLIGYLDDGAQYVAKVIAFDDLDQTVESDPIEFTVRWKHQATPPDAEIEFDEEYSVVKIKPTIDPEKYEEGDTFDIYRLSVDKPTLIVKGGTFGETYVDPYPTIGEFGGHRIVTITANGDFISDDDDTDMAWIDTDIEEGDYFESDFGIINYGEGTYEMLYNVDLSTQWNKDFKETRYLGGHIQGDWNAGVSRTSSISSLAYRPEDSDTIEIFRRLADYPGICHVRTLDGSNYYADVQVNESYSHDSPDLISYSFNITRVEGDGYDGIELKEWEKIISQ